MFTASLLSLINVTLASHSANIRESMSKISLIARDVSEIACSNADGKTIIWFNCFFFLDDLFSAHLIHEKNKRKTRKEEKQLN